MIKKQNSRRYITSLKFNKAHYIFLFNNSFPWNQTGNLNTIVMKGGQIDPFPYASSYHNRSMNKISVPLFLLMWCNSDMVVKNRGLIMSPRDASCASRLPCLHFAPQNPSIPTVLWAVPQMISPGVRANEHFQWSPRTKSYNCWEKNHTTEPNNVTFSTLLSEATSQGPLASSLF